MNITNPIYILDTPKIGQDVGAKVSIKATIDGVEMFVPIKVGNKHYDEIMRQVEAGELTIQDAEWVHLE